MLELESYRASAFWPPDGVKALSYTLWEMGGSLSLPQVFQPGAGPAGLDWCGVVPRDRAPSPQCLDFEPMRTVPVGMLPEQILSCSPPPLSLFLPLTWKDSGCEGASGYKSLLYR